MTKEKFVNKLRAWEIALLVIGSPIWLSLLISAFAVIVSLYVSAWSLVAALWACFAAFAAYGVGGIAAAVIFTVYGNPISGVVVLGTAVFSLGLTVLCFYACVAVTKWLAKLSGSLFSWISKKLSGRGNA